MPQIIIASQFAEFTNGRKTFALPCTNALQLMDGLRSEEPLLYSAIVEGDYCLKPFISLVIDDIPYADQETWNKIALRPDSTALIISAVAGG